MKRVRKIFLYLIPVLLIMLAVLFFANHLVKKQADGKIFSDIEEIPSIHTGLLLGTSKYLKNGHINLYFAYRVDAATNLFKAGKIKAVIISGDNSRSSYDEPTDMKNELVKNGVDSNAIYLDYAGFRTFDSIVRVKEIFGQDSIVLISQQFHNERAIYIAQKLGLVAYGFSAKDVSVKYGIKTSIREKFARVKVILDFMIGTKPKFLGEKIEIK